MTKLQSAFLFGFIFGIVSVLMMLPLNLPNKNIAILASFFNRFAIGFLIPLVSLPTTSPIKGLLLGLLISLPDAIISGMYAPILGIGALGGLIIGWLSGKI